MQDCSNHNVIDKHCRVVSTHEPHHWTYQAYVDDMVAHGHGTPKRIDPTQVHSCPGVEHADHDERCCPIHGTHADSAHVGCVMR